MFPSKMKTYSPIHNLDIKELHVSIGVKSVSET